MSHPAYEELEADLDRLQLKARSLGGLDEVEALIRRARRLVIRAGGVRRPSVAIIGASTDRSKFGNKAVRAFRNAGFDVYPVNPATDRVEGLPAYPTLDEVPLDELDRVSVYVPPSIGLNLLDQMTRKRVGEVWLNPGSDGPDVVARAESLGLNVVRACSILGVGEHPDRV